MLPIKRLTFITLITLSTSLMALEYSYNFDDEKKNLIEHDLRVLGELPVFRASDKTKHMFQIHTLSGSSLKQWLLARIKIILGTSTRRENYFIARDADYPNDILPLGAGNNIVSMNRRLSSRMVNVSADLYFYGKNEQKLMGLKLRSDRRSTIDIHIDSPRSGVIRILDMEKNLWPNQVNPYALSNTFYRLSDLFHEARHSDGHAHSLGFAHSVCPANMADAGIPTCDTTTNGAYSIEAQVLEEFIKLCTSCSAEEKIALSLKRVSAVLRIIPLGENIADDRPEFILE